MGAICDIFNTCVKDVHFSESYIVVFKDISDIVKGIKNICNAYYVEPQIIDDKIRFHFMDGEINTDGQPNLNFESRTGTKQAYCNKKDLTFFTKEHNVVGFVSCNCDFTTEIDIARDEVTLIEIIPIQHEDTNTIDCYLVDVVAGYHLTHAEYSDTNKLLFELLAAGGKLVCSDD